MAEYLSPGVYVEEIDSGMKPMEGVSTSTAGFVGMTERGKLCGTPEFIGSYMEFRNKFGGYLPKATYGERRYLPMAVEQFFANGGSRCFVMRILNDNCAASAAVKIGDVKITAVNAGAWSNLVMISCKCDSMNEGLYDLAVSCMESQTSTKAAYEESYTEVSLDPDSDNYIVKVLDKSLLVRADHVPNAKSTISLYADFPKQEQAALLSTAITDEGRAVDAAKTAADAVKKAKEDAEKAKEYSEKAKAVSDADAENPDKKAAAVAAATAATAATAAIEALTAEVTKAEANVVTKKNVTATLDAEAQKAAAAIDSAIKIDPEASARAKKKWVSVWLSGGADCTEGEKPCDKIDASILKGTDGGPGKRTGLCALRDIPEISIAIAPGVTQAVELQEVLTHCETMGNRVCILDMPKGENDVTALQNYRAGINSSFAAMYHPWLQVFDPLEKRSAFLPPSGAMAGIYARVDNTRGVHKAPANETIRNCTGLETLFGKSEQDMLNPIGVNLIRNIQGQGIRVWGARTCSSDSAWKYINVRRLFIFLEESIRRNTGWAVFEPNDQLLWTKVRNSLTSFLNTQWRSGALAGASESESFFVNVGLGSSMTQDDVLNGRMICQIGVAPSRPAEFIIFRISQIMENNS